MVGILSFHDRDTKGVPLTTLLMVKQQTSAGNIYHTLRHIHSQMTFLSVKYTQMTINLYLANNLHILLSPYICGLLNIDINVIILFVFVIIILSDNCFGI